MKTLGGQKKYTLEEARKLLHQKRTVKQITFLCPNDLYNRINSLMTDEQRRMKPKDSYRSILLQVLVELGIEQYNKLNRISPTKK